MDRRYSETVPAVSIKCANLSPGYQDDGNGEDDLLHLVVEIKGYRREDAKEKKTAMEIYWVPGVNHAGQYGRWAFAEFTEVYQIRADFEKKVESEFNKMIEQAVSSAKQGKAVNV